MIRTLKKTRGNIDILESGNLASNKLYRVKSPPSKDYDAEVSNLNHKLERTEDCGLCGVAYVGRGGAMPLLAKWLGRGN